MANDNIRSVEWFLTSFTLIKLIDMAFLRIVKAVKNNYIADPAV